MEERVYDQVSTKDSGDLGRRNVPWRDLRDWLKLLSSHGLVKSVSAQVDLNEELSTIAVLATQADENAPALLFENIKGDRLNSRVLANMLGSSKERFALAVGL